MLYKELLVNIFVFNYTLIETEHHKQHIKKRNGPWRTGKYWLESNC